MQQKWKVQLKWKVYYLLHQKFNLDPCIFIFTVPHISTRGYNLKLDVTEKQDTNFLVSDLSTAGTLS